MSARMFGRMTVAKAMQLVHYDLEPGDRVPVMVRFRVRDTEDGVGVVPVVDVLLDLGRYTPCRAPQDATAWDWRSVHWE